jgi:hypothetical protein
MKYYKAIEDSTTDVNGAWKPLKPLSEGYEFIGDEEYNDLLGKKAKARRQVKQQAKASGSSNKEARQTARQKIPTSKPARREAYLTLVKLNFRGFAYKLDSIITGTNTKLLDSLKEKWRKYGDWNELVDAVNKGKVKKPFVCGAKCRKAVLDTQNFSNAVETAVIVGLLSLAGVVINSLSGVLKQAQIGNQQREAIASAEKEGEDDFKNLSPEEQEAILKAEQELKNQLNETDNKKYILIGVGIIALLGIGYLLFKKKK